MVPTEVLMTVVLSSFALLGGAFYALVHVQGTRITDLGTQLGARLDDLSVSTGRRFDELSARMSALETRQHADMMEVRGDLGAVRAAIAGLDARLVTLEH